MDMAVVRSTTPASTGNQDYTESGFGTPTAAIVYGIGATSVDTTADHYLFSMGATDFTRQWVSSFQDIDNQGTTVCDTRKDTTNIIWMYDKSTTNTGDVVGTCTGTVTDGIRINFTTADYQAGIVVVLIKCTNAYADSPATASSGVHDQTSLGFRPQNVWTCYNNYGSSTNVRNSMGLAHEDGAGSLTQGGVVHYSQDGLGTSSVMAKVNNALIAEEALGADDVSLQDFDANGFSINCASGRANSVCNYLAIRDDTHDEGDVVAFQTGTSTGDVDHTGFGTTAKYVWLLTSESPTVNTSEQDSDANSAGVAILGTDNSTDSFVAYFAKDAAGTSDTATRYGAGVKAFDTAAHTGYDHVATYVGSVDGGFTLNYTTANNNVYWVGLVIGPDDVDDASFMMQLGILF